MKKFIPFVAILSLFLFYSCESLITPSHQKNQNSGFDFATAKNLNVTVIAKDNNGNKVSGEYLKILKNGILLSTGQTNEKGEFVTQVEVPTYLNELTIHTREGNSKVAITGNSIQYKYTVSSTLKKTLDTQADSDEDGVIDKEDDYPDDPDKAYNEFRPGSDQYGTYVFEDKWPRIGDYDFNDMVIDYNYNYIKDADNKVAEIQYTFVLRAAGARYENGFGVEIQNLPPDSVSGVIGCRHTEGIISTRDNNLEAGQHNAVIIPFDNAYSAEMFGTNYVNTNTPGQGTDMDPETLDVTISLNSPIKFMGWNINPFIFIDGERGKEVHVYGESPTNKVNWDYFEMHDDSSQFPGDTKANYYYLDGNNMPWGLKFSQQFSYPEEKDEITEAYLKFENWRHTEGVEDEDWYSGTGPSYRDTDKIY